MINKSDKSASRHQRFTATLWGLHLIWQSHRRLVLGLAACTLVRGMAPAGFAMAIRGLINAVTSNSGPTDAGLESPMAWLLIAFAVTIADSLTGLASQLLSDRLKSDLSLEVNSLVMQHAAGLDMPYLENAANREVLERVRQDPGEKLHQLFIHSQRAILAGCQVLSLAGILTWLEPAILLFALVLAVPFMIFQWRLSRRRFFTEVNRTGKRRRTAYYLSRLVTATHAGEIKLLGIGKLLTDRYITQAEEFRDQDQQLQLKEFSGGVVFMTVTTIAFYVLFSRVIMRAIEGNLSIGDVAIFGGAVVRLRSALETGIQFVARAYEQTLYVADLRAFLQSSPMVQDHGGKVPALIRGALTVDQISFTYPGSDDITLHDVSFELAPGERIAIVGENGSGKSTLAKLLARLYDVDAGTIRLDDQPLADYPLAYLHTRIALLGQSFGRYEASLADNIAYGDWQRLTTDRTALEQLATTTGVDHIAAGLPQGLDTQLGREFAEHDLSSGQLVAIARTLARGASVLILDEPTSNIDARAEHALYQAIDQIATGITTIVISHRFSTISMADRILVMDHGRIVEQGTHAQLLSAGGHYAGLYALHERYRMQETGVF
jgi:ATP-binding cassette subfamily B protein